MTVALKQPKNIVIVVITAFLLSAPFAIAGAFDELGIRILPLYTIALRTCFLFFIFLVSLIALQYIFFYIWEKKPLFSGFAFYNTIRNKFNPEWKRKNIVCIAVALFVCWLPYIIFQWPGALTLDSLEMLAMFLKGSVLYGQWSDHHNFILSALEYCIVYAGYLITGDLRFGVAAFVLLQNILTALILSLVICYIYRLTKIKGLSMIALFFFGTFPIIAGYAQYEDKDQTAAIFFTLFFIYFVEIVKTKAAVLHSTKHIILFILVTLAFVLARQTAIYVALPSLLATAVIYKKMWKKIFLSFVIVAAVKLLLLPLVIFPAFHIARSEAVEMYSPLLQQTGRYIINHKPELMAEEKEILSKVIGGIERVVPVKEGEPYGYNFTFQDTMKRISIIDKASDEDIKNYLKLWIRQGLKHPLTYLMATYGSSRNFLAPVEAMYYYSGVYSIELGSQSLDSLHGYGKGRGLQNQTVEWVAHLPILNLIFTAAIYTWWIPLCTFTLLIHNKRMLLCFIPIMLSAFFFCLVCPIADPRYALPLILCAPLLTALPLTPCELLA